MSRCRQFDDYNLGWAARQHIEVARILFADFNGHPLLRIRRNADDKIVLVLALSGKISLIRIEIRHHNRFVIDGSAIDKEFTPKTDLAAARELAQRAGLWPWPTLPDKLGKKNIDASMDNRFFYCNEFMYDTATNVLYCHGDKVDIPNEFAGSYTYNEFDDKMW